MRIKGFGINADAAWLENDLNTLSRALALAVESGFDYVEVSVHGLGVMAKGRLLPQRVRDVQKMLRQFPLGYTVHGPNPLNLMDLENLAWQKQALRESMLFAADIGSEVLVYHSGRYLPEEGFSLSGGRRDLTKAQKETMLAAEREALSELAENGDWLGVTIGLENARPYLDGSPYCYAECFPPLVELVASINHPRVGITLDVGHAYLAARHFNFNFLDAVSLAAPYVCHVHLHDNFGLVSGSQEKKQAELMATGRGDLHLPIGFGEIPLADVFARLANYRGAIIHEIRPRYRQWAGEALALGKNLLGNGQSRPVEIK